MFEEKKTVTIPEGCCCGRYQCSDCVFMNRSDYNRYGEMYCSIKHKYYAPDDITCSEFTER